MVEGYFTPFFDRNINQPQILQVRDNIFRIGFLLHIIHHTNAITQKLKSKSTQQIK